VHKLLIVGSGGHAKVIIDMLKEAGEFELIGCVSKEPLQQEILGFPILGDDSVLPQLHTRGINHVFIAIGDNARRAEIMRSVTKMGFEIVNAISKYSHISTSVRLGRGIAIMPGVVINVDSVIEDNAVINTGATVDHDCLVGAHSHIGPGCNIAGNVSIGQGSFLGVGCNVIPKINIGEWTVIGAGAVVINDLPGYAKASGVPAKIQDIGGK